MYGFGEGPAGIGAPAGPNPTAAEEATMVKHLSFGLGVLLCLLIPSAAGAQNFKPNGKKKEIP